MYLKLNLVSFSSKGRLPHMRKKYADNLRFMKQFLENFYYY